MISVIGRRRIGKTFLVNTVYEEDIVFSVTGLRDAPKNEQLGNFMNRLAQFSQSKLPLKVPNSWLEAFQLLIDYLQPKIGEKKLVVFFDELPWMAAPQGEFLRGLSFFWNSWAVQQHIVVVICGSAASWMIRKVVQHKGGLHNRITRRIFLQPFSLHETEEYLSSRNIRMDRYQILQLYMAVGGIPHYLKEVRGGMSAAQTIDALAFSATGLLADEFDQLYAALFDHPERHTSIIRALSKRRSGLTRNELLQKAKLPDGGSTTQVLQDLTSSGFITFYRAFGNKKKLGQYRLTDEYSLFYLKFIEPNQGNGPGTWLQISQSQAWKSWSGITFESLCLKHTTQIKQALGIVGVYTQASSYHRSADDTTKGIQIDLVLDRADHVISLIEMKFYAEPTALSKSFNDSWNLRKGIFRAATKTNKQLQVVLLSTFPVLDNTNKHSVVDRFLTFESLFAPAISLFN